MIVTLNWLKEFVDIDCSVDELAAKLTNSGFEVEDIIYQNKYLKHVVSGRIEKIEKHENAEKLVVCQVDIGKNIQIVTAATNIKVGDIVPVSLEGAYLANGIAIKSSKLRGVDSCGMFCSIEELGVTDYDGEKNGIMILDANTKVGEEIEKVLMMDDIILDINVTANRPDVMSIVGVAREVCAILNKPFKKEDLSYNATFSNIQNYIDVEIENENCFRYVATAVDNIKIEKSPLWLRAKLNAVGIKPINNIVDITNYVLTEYGQPMHAFDHAYLDGKKIIVRGGKDGEEIEVLNGQTYKLNKDMLCVCDANKPVVIAGIIGGTNSCVSNQTKTAIFESACFERSCVRRTSRKIGVRTDSTARFEKGVDASFAKVGMQKALKLVEMLGAGNIVCGIVDKIATNKNFENKVMNIEISKISKLLGMEVDNQKLTDILKGLDFDIEIDGNNAKITVPVYRTDIESYADIAEEYIRFVGYDVYDKIDSTVLENAKITVAKSNDVLKCAREIKNTLCAYGFDEILNFSICSPSVKDKLLLNKDSKEYLMINILNPISEDISCVRTCMANGMFDTINYNLSRKNDNFKFMEVGRIYLTDSLPLTKLPEEIDMLSFASVCKEDDFYTFKGYIENILRSYDFKLQLEYSNLPYLHSGISADYKIEGTDIVVASIGLVHPKVAKNFEISKNTMFGQINLQELVKHSHKTHEVKAISKYQSVERDLAVLAEEEITCKQIIDCITKSAGNMLESLEIFDIYRDAATLGSKKSIAFKFKLVSHEKTLVDDEINKIVSKILKDLQYKVGAVLR